MIDHTYPLNPNLTFYGYFILIVFFIYIKDTGWQTAFFKIFFVLQHKPRFTDLSTFTFVTPPIS